MATMPLTHDPQFVAVPNQIGILCLGIPMGMANIVITGDLVGQDAGMINILLEQFSQGKLVGQSNHDIDLTGQSNPVPVNINQPKAMPGVDQVRLVATTQQGQASLDMVKLQLV
jgi:hypothetical protein